MTGDGLMYRDLASRNERESKRVSVENVVSKLSDPPAPAPPQGYKRPEVMNFLHCIDQHCAPSIVYFFNDEIVQELCLASSTPSASSASSTSSSSVKPPGSLKTPVKPFAPLLNALFEQLTGINPRRVDRPQLTWTPFQKSRPYGASSLLGGVA